VNIQNPVHDETLKKALSELKEKLTAAYPLVRLVLFGSAARGEMDEESDVDVLVLTEESLTWKERDEISDRVFEINLRHDTNISFLAVDLHNWEEGLISVMPIREEIERERIEL
jgi:predicted nucleotidyltransferase